MQTIGHFWKDIAFCTHFKNHINASKKPFMWKNIRAPGVLSGTQAARNRYQFSAAAPTGKQTSRNNETRRQFPQQKPINLSLLTRGEIVHFSQAEHISNSQCQSVFQPPK